MSLVSFYGENYPVVQINGQRIVGPCTNWAKFNIIPDKDFKEIFIGHIPHELTEMDLLQVFAAIGPIWRFRLMMNFSGQNRGFGYIQYIFEEDCTRALYLLNGKEILPGHTLSACMSRNICTLVMGGFRRNISPSSVLSELERLVHIKHSSIKLEKGELKYYLTFSTHREAALARRTILSILQSFGKKGWVRWADH